MENVCEHFGELAKVGPPIHAVRVIIDLLKKKDDTGKEIIPCAIGPSSLKKKKKGQRSLVAHSSLDTMYWRMILNF